MLSPITAISDAEWVKTNAALANDVYNGASTAPIRGWHRIASTPGITKTGYFGAAYVNSLSRPTCVIIAHRGTSNIQDYFADYDILNNHAFNQLDDADNFLWRVQIDMYNRFYFRGSAYGDGSIEDFHKLFPTHQTGHSLGAIISDVVAAFNQFGRDDKFKHPEVRSSLTFENPGSCNILLKYIKKFAAMGWYDNPQGIFNNLVKYFAKRCLAVQSHVNLINTCNQQFGATMRMVDKPYEFTKIPELALLHPYIIPSAWNENMYYMMQNTMEQHPIGPIVNYLNAGGRIASVSPVSGFAEGYKNFLDVSQNVTFWKGYFQAAWDFSQANPFAEKEASFDVMYSKGIDAVNKAARGTSFRLPTGGMAERYHSLINARNNIPEEPKLLSSPEPSCPFEPISPVKHIKQEAKWLKSHGLLAKMYDNDDRKLYYWSENKFERYLEKIGCSIM